MYLGTSDIEFEEALASESATGSIAHSVVLVRVKDNANVELIKKRNETSEEIKNQRSERFKQLYKEGKIGRGKRKN